MLETEILSGRVKFVDDAHGYGYILPADESDPEQTLHFVRADAEGWHALSEGTSVSYCTEPTAEGHAVRVRPAPAHEAALVG